MSSYRSRSDHTGEHSVALAGVWRPTVAYRVMRSGYGEASFRRLPNELCGIVAVLEAHRAELSGVVVESTYNGQWPVDGLEANGLPVTLANTVAIKQYEGLKHGDDTTDACHLAHLLRLRILPRA
jgi:transposase